MKESALLKLLSHGRCAVLDGSMGAALERKGFDLNSRLWTARALSDAPGLVKEVHKEYFRAGADCGISDSYQASIPGFMAQGWSAGEARKWLASSMDLLREAREEWWRQEGEKSGRPYPLAAGSVGPYGAFLADGSEYTGNYFIPERELARFHRERMEILWEAGADCLAIETIPSLEEALLMAGLAEELKAQAWVSFSCADGSHTSRGDLLSRCAGELDAIGAVAAVGVNCTHPKYISRCIEELKKGTKKPIIVYPNSGDVYEPDTKRWRKLCFGPSFRDYAARWQREGASMIGGCCQTLPEHVREIAEGVRPEALVRGGRE